MKKALVLFAVAVSVFCAGASHAQVIATLTVDATIHASAETALIYDIDQVGVYGVLISGGPGVSYFVGMEPAHTCQMTFYNGPFASGIVQQAALNGRFGAGGAGLVNNSTFNVFSVTDHAETPLARLSLFTGDDYAPNNTGSVVVKLYRFK